MKKEKILYISDLDGTLLNKNAELSEYTKTTLNNLIAGGLNFSVATARSFTSAGKILTDVKFNIPVVLLNGVSIYDIEQKQYIRNNNLPPETVSMLTETLRAFEMTGFVNELKDGEYVTYYETLEYKPLRNFVEERIAKYNRLFQHTHSLSDIPSGNLMSFTLLDKREQLQGIYDALAEQPGVEVTMYEDNIIGLWFLTINNAEASKQNGVMYLREICGFEKVVGFGDNLNDLPMFAACDVKVAVENVKPEVKAAADYICDTNENDGVAKWLEENVLQ